MTWPLQTEPSWLARRALFRLRRLPLVAASVALLACSVACTARADDGGVRDDRWLFIPVFTQLPRDIPIAQFTSQFEIELRARGASVLQNPDAAVLFETRHSSDPVKLNNDEMTRLLKSVGQAARHLALGELPQAQQAMEGVYALSGPARDYLNREAARARKIFDTCLMTAYLWERDQKHSQALRQMLECSRSFPGFRPEGRVYPPELRALFEEAKHQLNQLPSTTLLVQSKQNASCGVRLNGIELGKSPMSFSDVRAGITRVQLECQTGVAGRIHAIELKSGENRLDIDPVFDAAVHSQSALWLQYANDSERSQRVDADLTQIQRALGSPHVVGLVIDGAATYPRVHVRPLSKTPKEIASVSYSVGEGYNPQALGEAVKQLGGREPPRPRPPAPSRRVETASDGGGDAMPVTPNLNSNDPFGIEPKTEEPAPSKRQKPIWNDQELALGLVLAAVGVGGIAASWIMYEMHYQFIGGQVDRIDAQIRGERADYPASQNPPAAAVLIAGGVGNLLVGISDYFWLPNAEGVPALAWVAGGLGAVIAITGIVLTVALPHCDESQIDVQHPTTPYPLACRDFTGDPNFGPLVALHALPFLGIPISYAIREATRPDGVQLAVRVGSVGNGFSLQLQGVF